MMTLHCIYKERDKTSFMRMKSVQFISNVFKTIIVNDFVSWQILS
jgi:hypothetical protein